MCNVIHEFVGGGAIIVQCVRQTGGGGGAVAAVEGIIPGLDLSLSNRNSCNYCGSIRLKRHKKKIFREREGCI